MKVFSKRGWGLCLLAITLAAPCYADDEQDLGEVPPLPTTGTPSDLEAVYLYDFARFVRWPAGADSAHLDICVSDAPRPFLDSLQRTVTGGFSGPRALGVRVLHHSAEEHGCDILFLDGTGKHLQEMLQGASGKPILTVSDAPSFLDEGGMMQFVMADNRLRFEVSLSAVGQSGLRLSAALLKVAYRVEGAPEMGGHL